MCISGQYIQYSIRTAGIVTPLNRDNTIKFPFTATRGSVIAFCNTIQVRNLSRM
jgi:hypothetical protein